MGDMGDAWVGYKEERAKKRAANRSASTELLTAEGLRFEIKNGGAHLRVEGYVDFWPGTGLWRDLSTRRSGRGVRHLINYLKDSKS